MKIGPPPFELHACLYRMSCMMSSMMLDVNDDYLQHGLTNWLARYEAHTAPVGYLGAGEHKSTLKSLLLVAYVNVYFSSVCSCWITLK